MRSSAASDVYKRQVKGLDTVAVTETKVRHILVKPSIILSDEGAQKELLEIRRNILAKKANFGEMAREISQDLSSATLNGELDYQTSDNYVPEFKHQVDTLPIGQISEPFKTVYGWHILEVLDRREVDKTDSAYKNKAYNMIFNRKYQEESISWLQEIRSSSYIEILKDNENDG